MRMIMFMFGLVISGLLAFVGISAFSDAANDVRGDISGSCSAGVVAPYIKVDEGQAYASSAGVVGSHPGVCTDDGGFIQVYGTADATAVIDAGLVVITGATATVVASESGYNSDFASSSHLLRSYYTPSDSSASSFTAVVTLGLGILVPLMIVGMVVMLLRMFFGMASGRRVR